MRNSCSVLSSESRAFDYLRHTSLHTLSIFVLTGPVLVLRLLVWSPDETQSNLGVLHWIHCDRNDALRQLLPLDLDTIPAEQIAWAYKLLLFLAVITRAESVSIFSVFIHVSEEVAILSLRVDRLCLFTAMNS